jgi:DNA-directed RNA polymerase subunit RPC12/RpoP
VKYADHVPDAAAAADKRHVVCPHCKKPFDAQPLPASAARYRGFKCPHCRLFVPVERAREHA